MGLIDLFCDWYRHRRIDKTNRANRGIVRYRPSEVGGFVEKDDHGQILLASGGDAQLRAELINSMCICAANADVPVIVLHQGDSFCERQLQGTFANYGYFYVANRFNRIFDPIYGMEGKDIVRLMEKRSPKEQKITAVGGDYLKSVITALNTKHPRIALPMLDRMVDEQEMNRLLSNGVLDPAVQAVVQRGFAKGQAESNTVCGYVADLKMQFDHVLPQTPQAYSNCCTLEQVVHNGGVLVLDVGSDANVDALRLLLGRIEELLRTKHFMVIANDLPIAEENGLKAFMRNMNGYSGKAIVCNNLYANCQSDDELFSTLAGMSSKWFVFKHDASGAAPWAKAFGTYKKIETSFNIGRGDSSGVGVGRRYAGWNTTQQHNVGESIYLTEEEVVRQQMISTLQLRQGFVFSKRRDELAFVDKFV